MSAYRTGWDERVESLRAEWAEFSADALGDALRSDGPEVVIARNEIERCAFQNFVLAKLAALQVALGEGREGRG